MDRDELRQVVVKALAVTERCYMGAQSLEDMADAAIAAYEAHRPRAAVVLTREEWADFATELWVHSEVSEVRNAMRAALPWIKVERE
jgi:hypothetical protein